MRWRQAAAEITRRLAAVGRVPAERAAAVLQVIDTGDPSTAFRAAKDSAHESGLTVGWNRLWRGDTLLAWCGPVVVAQPLRALALEIEARHDYWDDIRRALTEFTSGADRNLQEGSVSAPPLGLWGPGNRSAGLKLLQRLNLDTREEPGVERWHWSGDSGLAALSDGGRFQVRRELVWMRAIEVILAGSQALPKPFAAVFAAVEPGDVSIELPSGVMEPFAACRSVMQVYGLAELLGNQVRLAAQAGEFLQLASRLWG